MAQSRSTSPEMYQELSILKTLQTSAGFLSLIPRHSSMEDLFDKYHEKVSACNFQIIKGLPVLNSLSRR